jgi:chemotaxis protein CheD
MGLGSCVAVFMFDPVAKIGGVLHILLPRAPAKTTVIAKYADTGVRKLHEDVLAKGAKKERLRAKIVGGAQMFPNLNITVNDIGKDNVLEAKKALKSLGVIVISEDTHGNRGRSAVFDLETGRVSVKMAFSDEHFI